MEGLAVRVEGFHEGAEAGEGAFWGEDVWIEGVIGGALVEGFLDGLVITHLYWIQEYLEIEYGFSLSDDGELLLSDTTPASMRVWLHGVGGLHLVLERHAEETLALCLSV